MVWLLLCAPPQTRLQQQPESSSACFAWAPHQGKKQKRGGNQRQREKTNQRRLTDSSQHLLCLPSIHQTDSTTRHTKAKNNVEVFKRSNKRFADRAEKDMTRCKRLLSLTVLDRDEKRATTTWHRHRRNDQSIHPPPAYAPSKCTDTEPPINRPRNRQDRSQRRPIPSFFSRVRSRCCGGSRCWAGPGLQEERREERARLTEAIG